MGNCPLYIVCIYCVHIIVQFTLYTLVYSSHCTMHTAHCTMAQLVGRQLQVCTLHCTLSIVLIPCTLVQNTVPADLPAGTLSLYICASVLLCTVPVPVPQAHVPHSSTCSTLCMQVSGQHVYLLGDYTPWSLYTE